MQRCLGIYRGKKQVKEKKKNKSSTDRKVSFGRGQIPLKSGPLGERRSGAGWSPGGGRVWGEGMAE